MRGKVIAMCGLAKMITDQYGVISIFLNLLKSKKGNSGLAVKI